MDDYGCKLPTHKELFRFVQELSLKCERLEREVTKLKMNAGVRQKKVIVDCLNHPSQIPEHSFSEWWHRIHMNIPTEPTADVAKLMDEHWSIIDNVYLFRVFKQDLVEGMKKLLEKFVELETGTEKKLPVRCFTQKPNVFYVYSGSSTEKDAGCDLFKKPCSSWRIMTNEEFETMIDYLSQLFVREFLAWQRNNTDLVNEDESRAEEVMMYMMRVNSMRSKEKGMQEIRKWMFSKLEENVKTAIDYDFV
jgi:hypothetical protein